MIKIKFCDGGSVMTVMIQDGQMTIQRPDRGMTEKLEVIAKRLFDRNALGDESDKTIEFIEQSKNISVVIGEERCG